MNTQRSHSHPSRALVLAAFATVYVIWGSTYLAIRVAIYTLPPFLMAGCRFLLAGGMMFVWLRFRGVPPPAKIQWRNAWISGCLLLVTGNGLVAWAEQTVPSGLAALFVGLIPGWFALIDWLRPGGPRPQLRTILGILVGFAGMMLLIFGQGAHGLGDVGSLPGALALLVAGVSWAVGSLFSKHQPHAPSPWMNAAVQMLCGGGVLIFLSLVSGELIQMKWTHVTMQSWLALLYLIVFGSWIAFSAYVWLLKVSPASHVATYAYVNPVIALFLGKILLGEVLNARTLMAAAIILAGVIIITLPKGAILDRLPKGISGCLGEVDPQE